MTENHVEFAFIFLLDDRYDAVVKCLEHLCRPLHETSSVSSLKQTYSRVILPGKCNLGTVPMYAMGTS